MGNNDTAPTSPITTRLWNLFVIEDKSSDVLILKEALEEAHLPAQCEVMSSGTDALAALQERAVAPVPHLPDLILLDLNIPEMSGLEVLHALKRDPLLRYIPVLILSTSASERDVLEAYRLHANSYLQKPMEFSRFVGMLKALHLFWGETALAPPLAMLARRHVSGGGHA